MHAGISLRILLIIKYGLYRATIHIDVNIYKLIFLCMYECVLALTFILFLIVFSEEINNCNNNYTK